MSADSDAPAVPVDPDPAGSAAPGSADRRPLISARGLTKRFGDYVAVDGVDFDVRRGEVFGFLGPNGAGKTTIMRMIACVSPVTGGDLSVLGMDPRHDGPAIRARLGVVPQEDNLDTELTVWDNLLIYGRYFGLPVAVIRERANELLHFARLDDRRDSQVDPLSGGMKRRLDHRPRPHQPARPGAARRADDRPRPPGPPPAVGAPLPAQARRRHARASPRTTWTRPSSCATAS